MNRFIVALLLIFPNFCVVAAKDFTKPNFIIILADNLGYGDLGCYGSTLHRTPIIDRLARDGMRFTSCYSASGVCTPSRAALLTGCYAQRVNLHVSERGRAVLQPVSPKGLNPNEITIAEILKNAGYATACIGKWHVGDQPEFLPTRQGFDEFFGLPYSEDMTPRPTEVWPPLPLMRGERVIESPANCETLAERYAVEAAQFIRQNRNKPFFLYLAPAEPGSLNPPIAGARFKGKSTNGAWGDAVEELDWLVGEILSTLKDEGLDRKTLVIFTSDNGAPKRQPLQGRNAPLSGWGYTTAEGGMRVPFIARWPGKIPAAKSRDELVTLMDLLPTFANLAGTKPPSDRILDGKNFWPLLAGERGAKSPRESFYYYHMDQLQAVRDDRWKLSIIAPNTLKPSAGKILPEPTHALFDLKKDPAESRDLAAENPEVVRRLKTLAQRARLDLGDAQTPGRNQRPAGTVPLATPRALEHPQSTDK